MLSPEHIERSVKAPVQSSPTIQVSIFSQPDNVEVNYESNEQEVDYNLDEEDEQIVGCIEGNDEFYTGDDLDDEYNEREVSCELFDSDGEEISQVTNTQESLGSNIRRNISRLSVSRQTFTEKPHQVEQKNNLTQNKTSHDLHQSFDQENQFEDFYVDAGGFSNVDFDTEMKENVQQQSSVNITTKNPAHANSTFTSPLWCAHEKNVNVINYSIKSIPVSSPLHSRKSYTALYRHHEASMRRDVNKKKSNPSDDTIEEFSSQERSELILRRGGFAQYNNSVLDVTGQMFDQSKDWLSKVRSMKFETPKEHPSQKKIVKNKK
ncbi:hypothetical protein AKO1_008122 [Acrasis kona]|uniref:Uncharacterized protein n=1 Tax=Acrasis kona TaxID=1008807 RepID=A0AAW2YPH4_9EUKA